MLGTNSGSSCDPSLRAEAVAAVLAATRESMVVDGRFKGGWITRAYGRPEAEFLKRCSWSSPAERT